MATPHNSSDIETGETAAHVEPPDSRNSNNAHAPNVAVVAIHGVGWHAPGASAEAVATLLLSMDKTKQEEGHAYERNTADQSKDPPLYSGFEIDSIDVPLRPVLSPPVDAEEANDRYQQDPFERLWGIFDERRGFLSETRKRKGGSLSPTPTGYDRRELRKGEPDRGEYAYRFMMTQLAGYKGEVNRDFQTFRLEGKRKGNSPAQTVHIYDAHYSDLSKPQSNIVAFFFAFYQLVFHLASLSLLAVYWTEAENVTIDEKRRWRWRIVSSLHASSVRLLTMFVPILNVVLLEIACSAFLDKAQGKAWPLVSSAVAALLGLIATFILLRKLGSPSRPVIWALIPFLGAGVGILLLGGLACVYNRFFHTGVYLFQSLLLMSWLTIAGVLLGWVAWKFNQLRPGAFALSIVLYGGNAGWFLFYLLPHAHRQFAVASLWAVQWIFGELLLSWVCCLICALLTAPLAIFCTETVRPRPQEGETPEEAKERAKERRSRAIAAFRTGRFAFSIPAILFVVVTCALWSGIVAYGSYKLKTFEEVKLDTADSGLSTHPISAKLIPGICAVSLWMYQIDDRHYPACDVKNPPSDYTAFWTNYLKGLLLVSVTPSLPLTMTIFAGSLLLLIWAALPSIIFELKPEWTTNAAAERMRYLGEWLSRGLDNTAVLTRLLWVAIVPLPLLFFVLDWRILQVLPERTAWDKYVTIASQYTLPLIEKVGFVLAVSAAAVFGFILKYLTTILDAILDVDNYLRTSPLDETPRAKIAERITSMLRYIAQQTDELGRPYYSKLIIVAHSLGSMVTTDLLRYLERSAKHAPDSGLARYNFRPCPEKKCDHPLPIYVFSMGSPLRQLLNRFFPHLYWWVSDIPDNSLKDLGNPVEPVPGLTSRLPRTDEMNVTHWSNAYRSGDYIGRSLWVGQWMQRNASGNSKKCAGNVQTPAPWACDEMCVGLGAHTHYWDRSAPDIAIRLDRLIAHDPALRAEGYTEDW
jgi:hypothetical protein